ncbi:MAG TPA: hypothetical protein V6D33_12425 [Cyanophyceae cyanobacterium]
MTRISRTTLLKKEEQEVSESLEKIRHLVKTLPVIYGRYDLTEMAKRFMRDGLSTQGKLSLRQWMNSTKDLILEMVWSDLKDVVEFRPYADAPEHLIVGDIIPKK